MRYCILFFDNKFHFSVKYQLYHILRLKLQFPYGERNMLFHTFILCNYLESIYTFSPNVYIF